MRNVSKMLMIAGLIFVSSNVLAQKPKVVSGDMASLKSVTLWDVQIEFNAPEMHKYGTYEEFLTEMVTKFNEDVPGKGDSWLVKWNENINTRYNDKFCTLMNKFLLKVASQKVVVAKDLEGALGKIVIKPYWIYLGYVSPVARQPSKVSSKIHFLDADGKELLVVDMKESPGDIYSGAYGEEGTFIRVTESFAKCGKDLAGWLGKKVYN